MIPTLIIEDEQNAREALKKMLNLTQPKLKIIGEVTRIEEALDFLNNNQVELVFLDIELEDGTAFEFLEQLNDVNFKIIFTTAYNQFAIKAFKYSAIDYLLKPIDPFELKGAVEKSMELIQNEEEYKKLINVVKNNMHQSPKKIALKTAEQTFVFLVNDIVRLEAEGAYTHFITTNQKVIISKNIKHYQSLLDETFIRCHQSHLVNSKHILSIEKGDFLKMSNEDLVPISTRRKAEIKQFIQN